MCVSALCDTGCGLLVVVLVAVSGFYWVAGCFWLLMGSLLVVFGLCFWLLMGSLLVVFGLCWGSSLQMHFA